MFYFDCYEMFQFNCFETSFVGFFSPFLAKFLNEMIVSEIYLIKNKNKRRWKRPNIIWNETSEKIILSWTNMLFDLKWIFCLFF